MWIERVSQQKLESRTAELAGAGVRLFVLPRGIANKGAFFDAMQSVFPLDPPLVRNRDSWDALDDSFLGGLTEVTEARLAVFWPDSGEMARAHPQDFEIALSILTGAGPYLAGLAVEFGGPKQWLVLLAE